MARMALPKAPAPEKLHVMVPDEQRAPQERPISVFKEPKMVNEYGYEPFQEQQWPAERPLNWETRDGAKHAFANDALGFEGVPREHTERRAKGDLGFAGADYQRDFPSRHSVESPAAPFVLGSRPVKK
jgi:hypothetical protein